MKTRSSPSALESLPSEIFLSIAEHADFKTRLALSSTNSSCRTLLLPTVFRTLKVTSDEEESKLVLEFAKKIGANVQAISYHGTADPNLSKEGEDIDEKASDEDKKLVARMQKFRHQKQILPDAAAELLRGSHFPNVSTLIVDFPFDFNMEQSQWGLGIWDSRDDLCEGSGMYVFTVKETTEEMIAESEEEFAWRRLMVQTWEAVCENQNITKLVVKDLIPKAVSPFFTDKWKIFLGQIKEADLQIWGGDNGAGWEVGTLEGYMYFVSKMDKYFFEHMKNTTDLRISCYEHGPLGSDWTITGTMSLQPQCFPKLEHLQLEYAVLCNELVQFLGVKADTLKTVHLHECFASNEWPVRLTWADFFAGIRQSKPKWSSLTITNKAKQVPLTFKEWQESKYGKKEAKPGEAEEQEPDDAKRVRADLAANPNRRLFLYATLTDKYGDRWPDDESIIEHYDAGRDQTEFDALMEVIQGNASAFDQAKEELAQNGN